MPIGITRNLTSWRFQDHYVERVMDNAAYTSAHPDDTLVLAGPPRVSSVSDSSTDTSGSLLAIGMMQNLAINQVKNTTPVMAIGSGRSFFVSGKAQGSGNIARLFVNGRNLLRVLYHNARAAEVPVESFDDPAAATNYTNQYYINLDSELYLVPFGLGSIFRTKSHQWVGGFYAELTMIQSYSISVQAGMNMVAEQVAFLFDRLMPWGSSASSGGQDWGSDMSIDTLNKVIGFMDPTSTDAEQEVTAGPNEPPLAI